MSAEQQARDMLERMGFTAAAALSDEAIAELTRMIVANADLEAAKRRLEQAEVENQRLRESVAERLQSSERKSFETQKTMHAPVTISIDVQELLRSELGYTVRSDWDGDQWYEDGGNGRLVELVASQLAAQVRDSVRQEVVAVVHDSIKASVDQLIAATMESEIQLTSDYGEPRSPARTLRETMVGVMSERLGQRVDDQGKPLSGRSYGKAYTYLEWHARKAANEVVDREMQSKITDFVKQAKAKANELVATKIAEALGGIR